MNNETIEQKAIKLISKYSPWLKENLLIEEHLYEFDDVAGLIELAIAEEREANAVECDNLHHAWRWDNEADSESGPRQCAKAIRQRSAPKAEVSE